MSEVLKENGHEFVTGESLGFHKASVLRKARVCSQCGIVRRADGQNKPCRGKVRVTARRAA